MKKLILIYCLLLSLLAAAQEIAPKKDSATAQTVALSSLNLQELHQEDLWVQANRSTGQHPMQIGGVKYTNGVGTAARSVLWIDLQGGSSHFSALVGVDDEVVPPTVQRELIAAGKKGHPVTNINGSVVFQIYGDGRLLWKSGILRTCFPAEKAEVNLVGIHTLVLVASSAGDSPKLDHADWANAYFTVTGAKPKTIEPPVEQAECLTPKTSPKPRINGASVFGVRPGSPFLFTIAATGQRPIKFAAANLPKGLSLDPNSGRITGVLKKRGETLVTLRADNALGVAERRFKIVCGDQLALTPQMGWNTWNVFLREPDEFKVRSAADAMVNSGLIDHGWTYINIDDCWERKPGSKDPLLNEGEPRDADGMIVPSKRFPDMKGLCDYIHNKGLKAGIYSSPAIYTCQGFPGSYQHEEKDALQYARWGFDYLKYDWCYYDSVEKDHGFSEQQKPWVTMAAALKKVDRDIIFSLSQVLEMWSWAESTGANSWRTTGDISDTWESYDAIGFTQNGREKYAGPGHWNDCDMFVVGKLGGGKLHPTRLTPNEQYTHISLWCLLTSPLLIGCDMTQLDAFTLNLLSNDEVIEVNQDPLGRQARRISRDDNVEVWAKDMEDGSKAVGLFNRGEFGNSVTVSWSQIGVNGKQTVRDLWRQLDLGSFDKSFGAPVPRHGVKLLRIKPIGN